MMTINDKLRSRNIERWHTVATSIKQNIAEHSHCMGIIAEYLLEAIFASTERQPSITERYIILKYAQVHDLPEIVTGDISSPFKRFLKEMLPDFAPLMEKVEASLTPELAQLDKMMEQEQCGYLKIILKAADMLEAYSYFITCKGQDEKHNETVFNKLETYIAEFVDKGARLYPEFDWMVINTVFSEIKEQSSSVVIDFESELHAILKSG